MNKPKDAGSVNSIPQITLRSRDKQLLLELDDFWIIPYWLAMLSLPMTKLVVLELVKLMINVKVAPSTMIHLIIPMFVF